MPEVANIVKALEGLGEGFDVHVLHDAWYSEKAMTRAFGGKHDHLPEVKCVRVSLESGMLELHSHDDDKVSIMCYCCFGGDPNRGTFPLDKLKDAVAALKDHYCPPWPG